MGQVEIFLISVVAEADVFKGDRAVLYFFLRFPVLFARQITLFLQDAADTLGGGFCHRDHYRDHCDHHQAHENVHGVGEHAHQIAGGHAAYHNGLCAQPGEQNNTGIHCELHNRHHADHDLLRTDGAEVQGVRSFLEFFRLVILADVSFYHADTCQVFLYAGIESVVFFKHFPEVGAYLSHKEDNHAAQENKCA